MAQIKCKACGTWINDTDKFCSNCAAPNTQQVDVTQDDIPDTIVELRQWYVRQTAINNKIRRYLIGFSSDDPNASGICKNGNMFIVYENDANGKTTVKYKGTDEAYAVNAMCLQIQSDLSKKNEQVAYKVAESFSGSQERFRKAMEEEQKRESHDRAIRMLLAAIGMLIVGGIIALIGSLGWY
jgi:predicted nucleic acid-binding Zn ribbon protein